MRILQRYSHKKRLGVWRHGVKSKYGLIYPAIFNYRHSTESYLKAFHSDYKNTHKLKELYEKFKILIKEKFNKEIPNWLENIIIAIDEFDLYGTSFRYGDKLYQIEIFVD